MDSLRVFREPLPPLNFAARPQRNLTLFEGQSAGASTGSARLPFPSREETILPGQLSSEFRTRTTAQAVNHYSLQYSGADAEVTYQFDATKGLPGIAVRYVVQSGRP